MTLRIGQRPERSARLRMRARGFTLVELILVMVLICTILAIVTPSLRSFFVSRQASDAAGQIVALIQYARTQAISEGRPYRLNFDAATGTYWLTAQDGADFPELNTEFGRHFALPDGASFNLQADPNATVTDHIDFLPDGSSTAAAIGVIGNDGAEQRITSGDTPTLTDSFRVVAPPVVTGP